MTILVRCTSCNHNGEYEEPAGEQIRCESCKAWLFITKAPPVAAEGATDYGFKFGAALVERFTKDKRLGVVIGITTDKDLIQVCVTKTGKVRVFSRKRGELTP